MLLDRPFLLTSDSDVGGLSILVASHCAACALRLLVVRYQVASLPGEFHWNLAVAHILCLVVR